MYCITFNKMKLLYRPAAKILLVLHEIEKRGRSPLSECGDMSLVRRPERKSFGKSCKLTGERQADKTRDETYKLYIMSKNDKRAMCLFANAEYVE